MKLQRIVWLAIASAWIIALLAACSGGTAGSTSHGDQIYNVAASEFQFAPNKFPAKVGQTVTFKVTNKGTVEHTFVILSLDGSRELASLRTQPGEIKSLDFMPQTSGTYSITCNIPGHKALGMTGELDVP